MIDRKLYVIQSIIVSLFIFLLAFSVYKPVLAQIPTIEDKGEFLKYNDIKQILTKPLVDEKCWYCHQDMYPDLAPNPDWPGHTNASCFTDPNGHTLPLYYSTLSFEPNEKLLGFPLSANFTNPNIYEKRKKGHLSHLVYQPFGLGRRCLDCHDPDRYEQADPNTLHPSNGLVYFRDKETFSKTTICSECHGGFYPEGSTASLSDPNLSDPNAVRILNWGDPGSVTCLQCHDDSYEHGGEYASYISRYSSEDPAIIMDPNHTYFYHDWIYEECLITAPDPDKVKGQNYWSKNGHGVTSQTRYIGATLDTGNPAPNRPLGAYPNQGAMNSDNIPTDSGHSNTHDLNLNPDDGRKNFCWECHWSNEKTKKKICAESFEYPGGLPIGKYNGHLDTIDYRDERWGDPNEVSTAPHHQWRECRECHPAKYSHFVYKEVSTGRRKPVQTPRNSHCIVCHNPHGSGDEQGNANVFMIKRQIYKQPCNNCHFSQFQAAPCSPYPPPDKLGSPYPDPNEDTWMVIFLDPIRQDITESGSPENATTIPSNTSDICEVCHQTKATSLWPAPGGLSGRQHRNGSRHYFNPDQSTCANPNDCIIDYRGTDCTGCHIHDPGSVPESQAEIESSLSEFNSKAFAPTCRCHGIDMLDIVTFVDDEGNNRRDELFGKGHGTPPPPFPDGDKTQDPHTAHARYNYPCLRCHIDPNGPSYTDPTDEYIFDLDNYTPVGFDPFLNPSGIYNDSNMTCSNVYCHSNGKGSYKDINWSELSKFCRDPLTCLDTDGHFIYCDNCHQTPPDSSGTDHSNTPTSCDTCHPHNGLYEGKPGFYDHVNGQVEIEDMCTGDIAAVDSKCLSCHEQIINDPGIDLGCDSDKGWSHIAGQECTYCHSSVCDPNYPSHYDFQGTLPLSIAQNWDGVTGCGACHYADALVNATERSDFQASKSLHDSLDPGVSCQDCHGYHCELENINETQCMICHSPEDDIQVGAEYLHNQYNLGGGLTCTDCHGVSHKVGEMTFTEGNTQPEIELKCKACHTDADLDSINVSCDLPGQKVHQARENCLNCHDVFNIEAGSYKIIQGHYTMPSRLGNMEQEWTDKGDGLTGNDCGVCHGEDQQSPLDPSKRLHDLIASPCNACHGEHCDMDIVPAWEGTGSCGGCHVSGDIRLPNGEYLHAGIPSNVSCLECHEDHRSADALHSYLDDTYKCGYCHGSPPGISVVCNGIAVSGAHPPGATNCQSCHPGVYTGTKHYIDAGPVNVIQSWEGANSCGICHIDTPVTACGGGPLSIHATLGPASDCSQCHGGHCDMVYGDTPAKCIACHGPNPTICDICGPGSITSHYAFDTMGVNQAAIEDCLACHVEPMGGGEANPAQHIDNPQTFVKEGACLGCHSLARVRHGATDSTGCYACHPVHCVTEYARNDACIWCHTANPPIVDICQMGIGITSHMAFDSSVFNQIQVTNCIGCHVEPITGGEANPINHINDPMTYVNPLTCMGCHTVVVPHGGSGLPWEGGLWPAVNCYSCHPKHCFSLYCNNQACIWCHTELPPLLNVCGKPGLVPHGGDCVNCHAAGTPTGGECNPADHTNGVTYVRDGTCLACHPSVAATHSPGTEACILCHPVHCAFTYCSEPQCKACHNQPVFEIVSDYGCGIGPHDAPAYKECNRCHAGECNPQNHTLGPGNPGMPTDLSGMRMDWMDCGLCHPEAQAYHAPCNAPCTLCHAGTSPHACLQLDYCAENKCKCCHATPAFPIQSDYGCGVGMHAPAAYIDCKICHINECNPMTHMDTMTDVSNMALDWPTCGLCHADAQALHMPCSQPCTACHSGAGNHACLELNYCSEPQCKCCHAQPVFPIQSDYGCGVGTHEAGAYVNCTLCHIGECNPLNHVDGMTDVSNMALDWPTCGLCHADAQALHINCPEPCTACHSGAGNHSCLELNYCAEFQCKCCHIQGTFPINSDYGCGVGTHPPSAYVDCTMCHIGECNPLNHLDALTDVSNMPLDWMACGLCHADAQGIHVNCPQPCTVCHTGASSHACLELDYCAEPKCKCCHIQSTFPINSDYGCGVGTHPPPAYADCTMCHVGECMPGNHLDALTDVSNMPLDWNACGLCHADAQAYHMPCSQPCTACHSGNGTHACLELNYCSEPQCKCCHAQPVFPIQSDYGCGTGDHAANAYVECTMCHIEECNPPNHMDALTDVSNMPLDWTACGLCHADAEAIHITCPEPCIICHTGTSNHSCLELDYCTETQCKCCHAEPVFPINSDYGCGSGPHEGAAYIDCTICHVEECLAANHLDGRTDVANMPLEWDTCGLCHADSQASHVNCPEPCTVCHSGAGNHSCLELDYCSEPQCKCCHVQDSFPINSDYGCGTGTHPPTAYVDCTMCHIEECLSTNHLDSMTDVSNMPLDWTACGLCHTDAQAIHTDCFEPCNICHTGTSNHSCLELDYCAETKCKCCHALDTFPVTSDYGCGTGTHAAAAYVDCTMCHIGECTAGNHLDTMTDISNMPLEWATCGLCHADAQASHANCPETCTFCHSGTSTHACTELDYCSDQKCRCCHIDVPFHNNTQCDCATCHSAECDPLEHDITGVSTSHPMNPAFYSYTGSPGDVGCTCCHGYPPQALCVGISDTQDHCLDTAAGCSPQIYDCMPCHTLFNGQPNHISIPYTTPAIIASCACHGDSLAGTGAHSKHLTTPVMVPVYPGSQNVIDCQACHSSTTNLADHVVCVPGAAVTAPVQFDAGLPMIGAFDSYTPGATPGTGSCNLYCHSDGEEDPLDVAGTYTYFLGAPPLWHQTTGIVSCGNAALGTTGIPIFQCHGYPPTTTHPGGAGGGGGGAQLCTNCHPTPLLGAAPDSTFHINGAVDITGGGGGGGGGGLGGGGGGAGGGLPVI